MDLKVATKVVELLTDPRRSIPEVPSKVDELRKNVIPSEVVKFGVPDRDGLDGGGKLCPDSDEASLESLLRDVDAPARKESPDPPKNHVGHPPDRDPQRQRDGTAFGGGIILKKKRLGNPVRRDGLKIRFESPPFGGREIQNELLPRARDHHFFFTGQTSRDVWEGSEDRNAWTLITVT